MTNYPFVAFLGGLVVIILGAELILRSATKIAAMLSIKPIIIGLTIVALGTSAPELAVGITAVAEGKSALAVGNIAGTNLVNILFILGLSAAIRPLPLHLLSIRLDVPVMIASAVALFIMAYDGVLSRVDGALLVLGGIVYTVALIRLSKHETPKMKKEFSEEYSPAVLLPEKPPWAVAGNITLLIAGIGLTVLGANLLVAGAVSIAISLGVSDAVIGLTIVAIGTSAPELATTIVGTIKNDRDVAIGNLIGSSISNILVILGLTCVSASGGVDVSHEILWLDLLLGALVAIVCYPVFRSNRMVSRIEGILFVASYLLYLAAIVFLRA